MFDRLARQETVTIAIEGRVFAAADDMADPGRDARTEAFLRERRRLLLLAYRMVGSLTEAEDVVQEAWLRWQPAGESDTAIRNEAAWLTKVVTRLCVDHLRSPRLRRERCLSPWLPEPIAGADSELGPLELAEQRSTLSLAMLALLERLTPRERAAVVLAEAFDYSHAEVAEVLGVGYAASRQIHSRAMRRLADSRRRRRPVSRRQHVELLERFLDAAGSGDLGELTTVLVNDVVLTGDGGERRRATGAGRRPGRPLPARRARPAPGGRTGGGPADQRAAADRHGRWRGVTDPQARVPR